MGAAETETEDLVNNPSHYQRGGMEAIDVLEAFDLHRDGRLFSAAKYILRLGHKAGNKASQDARKAIWFLDRYASELEAAERRVKHDGYPEVEISYGTHPSVTLIGGAKA